MREMAGVAEDAARAGADALRARRRDMGAVRTKSSAMDVVTEADIAAGVAVLGTLRERVGKGLRVVVEEDEVYGLAGVDPGSLDDPEVWVVDPLDGTTSFVHDYPCYSVSVALLREGQPVAGAVYNVPGDEMYTAATGSGAFVNGSPIKVSTIGDRQRSLLVTGFPYERQEAYARQMRIFERLVRISHDVRRDGSAAIDCCHVAVGRCDGFWELGLHVWDMAAGVVILREAGAVVTDIDGDPWSVETRDLLAANREIHPLLLAEIAEAQRG